MNVIQKLTAANVPFSIVVSMITIQGLPEFGCAQEHHVIVCGSDLINKKHLGIWASNKGQNNLVERKLTEDNIDWFFENKNRFVKVFHNEHGQAWELSGTDFANHYKKNLIPKKEYQKKQYLK
jgi:hypothetical protein